MIVIPPFRTAIEDTRIDEKAPDYRVQPVADDNQESSATSRLFSLFSRRRGSTERPRSAIPFIQQSSSAIGSLFSFSDRLDERRTSTPAASDVLLARRRPSPGDLMELLRRSSAHSTHDSPRAEGVEPQVAGTINLPEEALAGLTEEERRHILGVVAASYGPGGEGRLPTDRENVL